MISRALLWTSALLVGLSLTARVRADDSKPPAVEGVEIVDRRGSSVPLDAVLRDQDGKTVRLGSYFDGKRPVVLTMAYYQCPMLCSLVLNGVQRALSELTWTAGGEYRALTISIDPRDEVSTAHAKRENYAKAYGRPLGDRGWDFLVADEPTARRIADSIGFRYRWDEEEKQFAHAAGAFVVGPDGVLSSTLYGISFAARDLRLALTEASSGKLGTVFDRVLLLCYHYDPTARGYVLAATRLMRAGGVLTAVAVAFWLRRLFRHDATQRVRTTSEAPTLS